ncbi:hypothetical protein BDY19DRAFT_308332 [Irpex rosettiformis]|uniref:Uncharacterized protein n=1 Tax=Irpex rosettiformis TaxID=378272 RepID=A0ACB8TYV9_9APHY|nr:hypothetical protein BDY19DRAFT_308332 [Irpex rosettiformis]
MRLTKCNMRRWFFSLVFFAFFGLWSQYFVLFGAARLSLLFDSPIRTTLNMSDLPFMVRAMPWMQRITLILLSIFSAIVIRSEVDFISLRTNPDDALVFSPTGRPDPFAQFGLAVGIITVSTLLPLRITALIAPNAFVCTVFFEILWFGVLLFLWLATGIISLLAYSQVGVFCSLSIIDDAIGDVCLDVRLSGGLGMASFAVLLLYYIPLVSLSALATGRHTPVWWESASRTEFGYGVSTTSKRSRSQSTLDSPTEFKSVDVDFEVKGARVPV